jgi:hypothetical protein
MPGTMYRYTRKANGRTAGFTTPGTMFRPSAAAAYWHCDGAAGSGAMRRRVHLEPPSMTSIAKRPATKPGKTGPLTMEAQTSR